MLYSGGYRRTIELKYVYIRYMSKVDTSIISKLWIRYPTIAVSDHLGAVRLEAFGVSSTAAIMHIERYSSFVRYSCCSSRRHVRILAFLGQTQIPISTPGMGDALIAHSALIPGEGPLLGAESLLQSNPCIG